MKLGRVIGTVVATCKELSLEGVKLLLVEPLDERLEAAGDALVACDAVQSAPGDIVMFEGGREAAIALPNWFNPSDATIFGILDRIDCEDSFLGGARRSETGSAPSRRPAGGVQPLQRQARRAVPRERGEEAHP